MEARTRSIDFLSSMIQLTYKLQVSIIFLLILEPTSCNWFQKIKIHLVSLVSWVWFKTNLILYVQCNYYLRYEKILLRDLNCDFGRFYKTTYHQSSHGRSLYYFNPSLTSLLYIELMIDRSMHQETKKIQQTLSHVKLPIFLFFWLQKL